MTEPDGDRDFDRFLHASPARQLVMLAAAHAGSAPGQSPPRTEQHARMAAQLHALQRERAELAAASRVALELGPAAGPRFEASCYDLRALDAQILHHRRVLDLHDRRHTIIDSPAAQPHPRSASYLRAWTALPQDRQRALYHHMGVTAYPPGEAGAAFQPIDPVVQRAEATVRVKQQELDQQLSALRTYCADHPLLSRIAGTRRLEDTALETARQLGAAQHDLVAIKTSRGKQHHRSRQRHAKLQDFAREMLPRQRALAADPARRLAFEAFARARNASPRPPRREGVYIIVDAETHDGATFLVLFDGKRRLAADLRDTGLGELPTIPQPVRVSCDLKLTPTELVDRPRPCRALSPAR